MKEDEEQSPQNWKIKMLYDGDSLLCMREVNMLRERNKHYVTIKFADISSDEYSPEENQGLDYKPVMGRIHVILSDGTVVTDVEVSIVQPVEYIRIMGERKHHQWVWKLQLRLFHD
uniref:Uncharacterized protein n=1 Tax=Quercus lobata TaxID=97700 RepID=A0A7N2RF02_QUELO